MKAFDILWEKRREIDLEMNPIKNEQALRCLHHACNYLIDPAKMIADIDRDRQREQS